MSGQGLPMVVSAVVESAEACRGPAGGQCCWFCAIVCLWAAARAVPRRARSGGRIVGTRWTWLPQGAMRPQGETEGKQQQSGARGASQQAGLAGCRANVRNVCPRAFSPRSQASADPLQGRCKATPRRSPAQEQPGHARDLLWDVGDCLDWCQGRHAMGERHGPVVLRQGAQEQEVCRRAGAGGQLGRAFGLFRVHSACHETILAPVTPP